MSVIGRSAGAGAGQRGDDGRDDADGPGDPRRLEHDRLAATLAVRRSIDHLRRAAYAGFGAILAGGLGTKLAYDLFLSTRVPRFQGSGVWPCAALGIGAILALCAVFEVWRCRRLMRDEDAAFTRLKGLRRTLDLDP